MKILLINKFFYPKGGSETLFFNQAALLKKNGHEVCFFSMRHPENLPDPNDAYFLPYVDYEEPGPITARLKTAGRLLYSKEAQRRLTALIEREKPDIAHLHNIHHQISPSILPILKKHGIPVVMTLHDYKMVCPVYTLFRNGEICEDCGGMKYVHCALNRCTKSSLTKSLLNSLEMYLHHSFLRIYQNVDVFISPSMFLADKALDLGFKPRIRHLPNFMEVEAVSPVSSWEDRAIACFGRLSPEKGLPVLLKAVQGLDLECRIYGDGPERPRLEALAQELGLDNVRFEGHLSQPDLHARIQKTMFVVLPSIWYENHPYAVAEAFALGKPVVASRLGGLPEMVRDGLTGLTFNPGKPGELREKILHLRDNSEKISTMGKTAREFAEAHLSPNSHYDKLLTIYQELLSPTI
jgi:glycosyltransferase involved in cell wall biosynthesis